MTKAKRVEAGPNAAWRYGPISAFSGVFSSSSGFDTSQKSDH